MDIIELAFQSSGGQGTCLFHLGGKGMSQVKVFIDTDMGLDVDDAVALTLAVFPGA